MDKQRDSLTKISLENFLPQILPPVYFNLQYKFKSGEAVDAVIHISKNMVPIDAKFPLENFQKYMNEEDQKKKEDLRKKFVSDVKKHIGEISKKYILPDEGTYDFALMYIPAENVYYETIVKEEDLDKEQSIFSYALKKRIIPVSPNSFYAYLNTIVQGLKALDIEKSAREIFQGLTRLQKEAVQLEEDFTKLQIEKSGYEKFTFKSYKVVPKATVTISKWGIISLNKTTIIEFISDDQNYCLFYFNRNFKRIGIKPIAEYEDGAFKINRNKKNNYASITANSFLKHFQINFDRTSVYGALWDKEKEMIIFDIDKPIKKNNLEQNKRRKRNKG
jgi:hypothetical protein